MGVSVYSSSSSLFPSAGRDYGISLWVRIPTATTFNPTVDKNFLAGFDQTGAVADPPFVLRVSGAGPYDVTLGATYSGASYTTIAATGAIPDDNAWHHIMGFTYRTAGPNRIYYELYVDGAMVASNMFNPGGDLVFSGSYLTIGYTDFVSADTTAPTGLPPGTGPWTDLRYFPGEISDVRVYNNIALTLADVTAVFGDVITAEPLPPVGVAPVVPGPQMSYTLPSGSVCTNNATYRGASPTPGTQPSGHPSMYTAQCFELLALVDLNITGYIVYPFAQYPAQPTNTFYEWRPPVGPCSTAGNHPLSAPAPASWRSIPTAVPAVKPGDLVYLQLATPRVLLQSDKACICIGHASWQQVTAQGSCTDAVDLTYPMCPMAGSPSPPSPYMTLSYAPFTKFLSPAGSVTAWPSVNRMWMGEIVHLVPKSRMTFPYATVTVTEGTTVTSIYVSRSNSFMQSVVTLLCTSQQGTAISGADFAPVNALLTWNPGDSLPVSCLNPPGPAYIINDNIGEGPETYTMRLSGLTGLACFDTTSITVLTVTIAANQQINIEWITMAPRFPEGSAPITFGITRTGGNGGFTAGVWFGAPIGVSGRPSADTAFNGPGLDYNSPVLQNVTFGTTDTIKYVTAQPFDDGLAEADETLSVTLHQIYMTVPGITFGSINPARKTTSIIIPANQPFRVRMEKTEYNVTETALGVTIGILRVPVAPNPTPGLGKFTLTLSYQVVLGASPGLDFLPTPTTVVFQAGDMRQDITVPIVLDGVPEVDEVFSVNILSIALDGPTNIGNGLVQRPLVDTATVRILGNAELVASWTIDNNLVVYAETSSIIPVSTFPAWVQCAVVNVNSSVVDLSDVIVTPLSGDMSLLAPGYPIFPPVAGGTWAAAVILKPAGNRFGTLTFSVTLKFQCSGNPFCTSVDTKIWTLTIRPPRVDVPAVASFAPQILRPCGGEVLTVSGIYFGPTAANLTAVTLSATPCTSFTWVSETRLTCVTPVLATGAPVNLTIVTTAATGVCPVPVAVYFRPEVSAVAPPALGSLERSATVTLTGLALGNLGAEVAAVSLAGISCDSFAWQSNTTVTCVAGSSFGQAVAGIASVTTALGCAQIIAGAAFNYYRPLITAVSPQRARPLIDVLTLHGTGFPATAARLAAELVNITVVHDGLACVPPVTWLSPTSLSCLMPFTPPPAVATTPLPVVITTTRAGVSPASPQATVLYQSPAASILSFSPVDGQFAGTRVVVRGLYMWEILNATVAGVACEVERPSTFDSFTCVTAAPPPGTTVGPVVAATASNGVAVSAANFSFEPLPPGPEAGIPVITLIEPNHGAVQGGDRVNIYGYNLGVRFADVTALSFGGVSCLESLERFSSTHIVCVAPPSAVGPVKVPVRLATASSNNVGSFAYSIRLGQYQYEMPPAVLVEVSPRTLTSGGGTRVTIRGDNFYDYTSFQNTPYADAPPPAILVSFGVSPVYACDQVALVDVRTLTCVTTTMPDASNYVVNVVVLNTLVPNAPGEDNNRGIRIYVDDLAQYCPETCGLNALCVQNECLDPNAAIDCVVMKCACKAGFSGPPLCESPLYRVELGRGAGTSFAHNGTRLVTSEDGREDYFDLSSTGPLVGGSVVFAVTFDPPVGEVRVRDPGQARVTLGYPGKVKVVLTGVQDRVRDDTTAFAVILTPVAGHAADTTGPPIPPIPGINLDHSPVILSVSPQVSPLAGRDVTVVVTDLDPLFNVTVGGVACPAKVLGAVAGTREVFQFNGTYNSTLHPNASQGMGPVAVAGADTVTTLSVTVPAQPSPGYHDLLLTNVGRTEALLRKAIFYTDDCPAEGRFGSGKDCRACPEGATCPGGNRIWPAAGYWNPGEDAGYVMRCDPPSICLGGAGGNALCTPGRKGPLCAQCDPPEGELMYLENNRCIQCPARTHLVGFVFADFMLWFYFAVCHVRYRDRITLAHFVLLIRALQQLGAVGRLFSSALPHWASMVFQAMYFFTGDVNVLRSECTRPTDRLELYIIGLLHNALIFLPSVLLVLLARGVAALKLRRSVRLGTKTDEDRALRLEFWSDRLVRVFALAPGILHFSLTRASLEALACFRVPGNRYLMVTMPWERACYRGPAIADTAVSCAVLASFGLLFPVLLLNHTRRNELRRALDYRYMERFSTYFAPLGGRFPNFYVVDFVGNVALAVGVTAAGTPGQALSQVCVVGGVFLARFVAVCVARPYSTAPAQLFQGFFSVLVVFGSVLAFVLKQKPGLLVGDKLNYVLYVYLGSIGLFVVLWVGLLIYLGGKPLPNDPPKYEDPEVRSLKDAEQAERIALAALQAAQAEEEEKMEMQAALEAEKANEVGVLGGLMKTFSTAFAEPTLGSDPSNINNDNNNNNGNVNPGDPPPLGLIDQIMTMIGLKSPRKVKNEDDDDSSDVVLGVNGNVNGNGNVNANVAAPENVVVATISPRGKK